jgi:hypothetical protein
VDRIKALLRMFNLNVINILNIALYSQAQFKHEGVLIFDYQYMVHVCCIITILYRQTKVEKQTAVNID